MSLIRIVASISCAAMGSAAHAIAHYRGPVAGNAQVVMVTWDAKVPSVAQSGLPQFYTDIMQSDFCEVLAEYQWRDLHTNDVNADCTVSATCIDRIFADGFD